MASCFEVPILGPGPSSFRRLHSTHTAREKAQDVQFAKGIMSQLNAVGGVCHSKLTPPHSALRAKTNQSRPPSSPNGHFAEPRASSKSRDAKPGQGSDYT